MREIRTLGAMWWGLETDLFTVWLLRHSQRKRGETARPDLRNTAPVLDPTGFAPVFRKHPETAAESALHEIKTRAMTIGGKYDEMEPDDIVKMAKMMPSGL